MRPLMLLLLLALPAPGLAQKEVEEERALDLFEEGQRLYQQGQYQEALELMRAAYAITSNSLLLYNIALCHQRLGHLEQALRMYREYLERNPGARNRSKVEGRISKLEVQAGVGEVVIATAPPGAQVLVDGSLRGISPLKMPLRAGRHRVVLTKEGYRGKEMEVDVVGGREATFSHQLEPTIVPPVGAGPTPSPEPAGDWMPSAVAWAFMAVGAAALGGGGISGGLAAMRESDGQRVWGELMEATSLDQARLNKANGLGDDAQTAALAANVLYISGGVALATGLLIWLLSPHQAESQASVGLGPGGVALGGRF